MGISITKVLNKQLEEIKKELREKFNVPLVIVDKNSQAQKSSVLFEYFVLYNAVLALEPDSIKKVNLKGRGGSSLLIPGVKYYKTIGKYGEIIEPSIIIQKGTKEFAFWFDRPFVYLEERLATLRPDILIREGQFEFKDLSYQEEKAKLFKDGELIAEFGVITPNFHKEFSYQIRISDDLFGHKIYFKFKEEFIHPPLIIEVKSFGAVLGNPEEYAKYAEKVAIVTPEKIYEPKKENLYIIRIENSKRISNEELRTKLRYFYKQIKLI